MTASPERTYFAECPETTLRVQVTLTAEYPSEPFPDSLERPCINCDHKHTYLPMMSLEEFMNRAAPQVRDDSDVRFCEPGTTDTSQPYFLDLISRIEEVMG